MTIIHFFRESLLIYLLYQRNNETAKLKKKKK